MTREAVEAFSTRRTEILAALAKEDRGSARERELATLSTRRGKELEPDAARQVDAWKETASASCFDPAQLIKARIGLLQERGLLVSSGPADRDRMLTTEQALAMETRVIALAQAGKDSFLPIADKDGVVARLKEQAGVAILTSRDRVHLVQGDAGVRKSAALSPVAAITREEGRQGVALVHVGRAHRTSSVARPRLRLRHVTAMMAPDPCAWRRGGPSVAARGVEPAGTGIGAMIGAATDRARVMMMAMIDMMVVPAMQIVTEGIPPRRPHA